jgi:LytS/YehU family sensor histidine kinase
MLAIACIDYKLVKFIHLTEKINKNIWIRILFEVLSLSVLAATFVFVGNIPFKYQQGLINYLESMDFLEAVIASILLNIFTITIIEFFIQYQQNKDNEIQYQQLQVENAQIQYKQLKGQINPHFLFNSLNVLVSLINKDTERATDYTKKLSEVYRYVLTHDLRDVITLREEITFINNYIEILKIRFDKGLSFEINMDEKDLDSNIIPMTLQVLIENAIKHNIVSASKYLTVKITINNGYIIVANKISPRSRVEHSTGIGLKILQEKYRIIADKEISIENNNSEFIVQIPII